MAIVILCPASTCSQLNSRKAKKCHYCGGGLTRDGRRMWYVARRIDGKLRRVKVGWSPTEEEAIVKEGQIISAKLRGDLGLLDRNAGVTLSELLDWYEKQPAVLARKSASDTLGAIRRVLAVLNPKRTISLLSSDTIAAYQTERLGQGIAEATINREVAALKGMLSRAAITVPPKISFNPLRHVQMLAEQNVRDVHQPRMVLAKLLRASAPWARRVFHFAGRHPTRRAEIESLDIREIDLAEGRVNLGAGRTKTGLGRSFPLHPLSRRIIAKGNVIAGAVWRLPNGRPVNTIGLRREFARAVKAAGLDRAVKQADSWTALRFHDLRHIAADLLISAGTDPHQVLAMGGWSTTQMLKRYSLAANQRAFNIRFQPVRQRTKREPTWQSSNTGS